MEKNHPHQEEQKIFSLAQKNSTYYETVFRRPNVLKELVLGYVFSLCSFPRLVLEVFLRRNMGERYFSMAASVSIVLLIWLYAASFFFTLAVAGKAWLWAYMSLGLIAFSFVFLRYARQRQREINHLPSVFDFARFSMATGEILPYFDKYKTNRRKLSTIYEPATCFVIGLLLLLVLQIPLAILLMTCSLIYSLSYYAAYHQGDNYLMDKIDQRICETDMADTFRLNLPYNQTRGAEFFGYQPADPEERRRVSTMLGDEPAFEVN